MFPKLIYSLLLIIWSGLVLFNVYDPMRISKLHEIGSIIWNVSFPLLVILMFFSLVWLIYSIFKSKTKSFTLPLWLFGFVFLFFTEIVILAKAILLQVLKLDELLPALLSLSGKLILDLSMTILPIIIWYFLGEKILKLLKLDFDKKVKILISIGLSFIIHSIFLLMLSLTGNLKGIWILGILLIEAALGGIRFSGIWRLLKTKINPANFTSNWIDRLFVLLIICQSILSLAILVTPYPTGFDSLSYYFKLARELADTGSFVLGQFAMPVELLYGSHMALADYLNLAEFGEMLAVQWAWWAGIFGLFGIYYLGKKLKNQRLGLVAAAVYYTTPLIGFFFSFEPKPDIFVIPFFVLALIVLLEYWSKLHLRSLLLISLMLNFSFNIKITSVFGILAFCLSLGILWIWQKKYRQFGEGIIAFILGVLLLLMPWFVLHIREFGLTPWQALSKVSRGDLYGSIVIGQHPAALKWRQDYHRWVVNPIASSGFSEDYGRYEGKQNTGFDLEKYIPKIVSRFVIFKYLQTLWNVTALNSVDTVNFMISPVYFIFLAFALIPLLFQGIKKLNSYQIFIALFCILYLIIWLEAGRKVSWYGIGLIIPLSIISIWVWMWLKKYLLQWAYQFGWLLIIFTCFIGIIIQAERLKSPTILAYSVGKITKYQAASQLTYDSISYANIINQDQEIINKEKRVIISGSYLHYFLNNYYDIAINDLWMDYLAGIVSNSNGDYAKAKETLKQLKIKYIIFNIGTYTLDESSEATLTNKHQMFLDFATKQLQLRDYNKSIGLLLLEVV